MLDYRKDNQKKGLVKWLSFLHLHIVPLIVVIAVIAGIVGTVIIVRENQGKQQEEGEDTFTLEPATVTYLPIQQIASFDPLASNDADMAMISPLLYSSLFVLDDTLGVEGQLVSDYTADPGTGSVALTLRQDAVFSNGTGLTADDVEFTISTIRSIGAGSPYYVYISRIGSVTVTGEYTLTITFASPTDAALDNLVFPIVCQSAYGEGVSFAPGTGPYKYQDYEAGKSVSLAANPYYYGTAPSLPVELMILSSRTLAPGYMTMGAVTAYVTEASDGDSIAKDKDLAYQKIPSSRFEYVGFNCTAGWMADVRMRQAVAYAINQEEIVRDNYGGSALVSDSLYYPGFLGSSEDDAYGYDPQMVATLFGELGLKDVDEDGVLETATGEELVLTILVSNDVSSRADTAVSIQEQLGHVGLQATVVSVSRAEYNSKLASKSFDLYLGGMTADKQFRLTELFTTNNPTGFADGETLAAIGSLELCQDQASLEAAFAVVKEKLNQQMPYYAICYQTDFFLSVDTLQTSVEPTFWNWYRGCESWTWERKIPVDSEK